MSRPPKLNDLPRIDFDRPPSERATNVLYMRWRERIVAMGRFDRSYARRHAVAMTMATRAYRGKQVRACKSSHIFSIIFLEFPIHPRDPHVFPRLASSIPPADSAEGFVPSRLSPSTLFAPSPAFRSSSCVCVCVCVARADYKS